MIVLDASVVVEMLTDGALAGSIMADLAGREDSFIVPHLLDIEVLSAIRRLAASRHLDSHRVGQILMDLEALPVARCPHTQLVERIWELRHNFTAYDAAYIALAEATDSVLYTCDQKLSKGHRARVALFTD